MSVSDNIDYIQNGENIDEVVLNRPSQQLAEALDSLSLADAIKKESTMMLDFANNEYRLYEGDDGQTWLPFEEVMEVNRASVATYIDGTGRLRYAGINEKRIAYDGKDPVGILAEEQRTNYLRNSENFLANWGAGRASIEPYAAIAPDGRKTAAKITATENNASGYYIYQSVSSPSPGSDFCFSFFVKPQPSSNYCLAIVYDGGSNGCRQWFDLENGVPATTNVFGAGFSVISSDVESLDDGWYRCSMVVTTSGSTIRPQIYPTSGTSQGQYNAVAGDYGYVWGAQLEAGSIPTSYIPSTDTFTSRASAATYFDSEGILRTAGYNVARDNAYGFDNRGRIVPIGLLLEPQRANLFTWSEDATTGTGTVTTINTNSAIAPDGTMTADDIVDNSTGESLYWQKTRFGATATEYAAGSYSGSLFLKKKDERYVRVNFQIYGTSTFAANLDIDFDEKTVTPIADAKIDYEWLPGDWVRVSLLVTTTTTNQYCRLLVYPAMSSGGYNAALTGGVYVWGAQFEAGEYATSYIPTEDAETTRSADIANSAQSTRIVDDVKRKLTSEFSDSSDATIILEFKYYGVDAGSSAYGIFTIGGEDPSVADDRFFEVIVAGNTKLLRIQMPGATPASYDIRNILFGETVRLAVTWNSQGSAVSINGEPVITSTATPQSIQKSKYTYMRFTDLIGEAIRRTNIGMKTVMYTPKYTDPSKLSGLSAV